MNITFVHPGSIKNISGGTIYDLKIINALTELFNVNFNIIEIANKFPVMDKNKISDNLDSLDRCGDIVIIDGLVTDLVNYLDQQFFSQRFIILLFHNPLHLGGHFTSSESSYLQKSEQLLLRKIDAIICTSKYSQNYLKGNTDKPILVAQPGRPEMVSDKSNISRLSSVIHSNKKLQLLSIGSVNERKNQIYVLNALKRVIEPVHYDIVGPLNNKYLAKIKSILDDINHHTINIHGGVDSVNEFYNSADVFVHTPIRESYGMVLIEAMAFGLPVITSKVDGIPYTVGDSAIFVDLEDPSYLSNIIESFQNNPEIITNQKKKSLQHFQNIPSWQHVTTEIYTFIRSLL